MHYIPYEKYKPARLEWIDVIPQHWDLTRLRLLSKRYSGGTPSKDNQAYWQEGTIPWLNSGAVNQGVITRPSTYITELGLKESSAKWIPKKAIIIALAGQGKTKGTTAYTTFETTCNQSMGVVVFEKDHSKFMYWWLTSQYKNIRGLASDDGRDGLNLEMLGTIPCPLPSIKEQMQITAFLDYKTKQIDRLIEKKKELIEKLEEQRIAVITQAVTRGIDENAKLKPSGVERLGDVPEHWLIAKAKYFSTIHGGYAFSSDDFQTDGVQLLRIGNVYQSRLALERQPIFLNEIFVESHKDFVVKRGDIIMSLTGTLGKTDYGYAVQVNQDGPFMLNQRVAKITALNNVMSQDYLVYAIRSDSYLKQLYSLPSGTKQANLSNDNVVNIPIAAPPTIVEQVEVASFIDTELKKIDKMAEVNHLAINKLEEYRSAIITSAVTGKIDVRQINIPEVNL